MNHTVVWDTAIKGVASPDLTQTVVWIETPDGVEVVTVCVPAGTTMAQFELPPGDYVQKVAATNADATTREGTISRAFTLAATPPPNARVGFFPLPVWPDSPPPEPQPPEPPDVADPPDKAAWETGMIEWGIVHGDALSTLPEVELLNHVYYDMGRVMYQI